jgi:hypothetical protein
MLQELMVKHAQWPVILATHLLLDLWFEPVVLLVVMVVPLQFVQLLHVLQIPQRNQPMVMLGLAPRPRLMAKRALWRAILVSI